MEGEGSRKMVEALGKGETRKKGGRGEEETGMAGRVEGNGFECVHGSFGKCLGCESEWRERCGLGCGHRLDGCSAG